MASRVLALCERIITWADHQLPMTADAAGLGPAAAWAREWTGLRGLQELRALDRSLRDEQELERYAAELARLHQAVLEGPARQLLVAEEAALPELLEELDRQWADSSLGGTAPAALLPAAAGPVRQLWSTHTQVNFCATAYPTVPADHEDAAALTVLGGYLRNGYLHRAIRAQGGAYGGGASHDDARGAFRFYAYRDPRLEATLADFPASRPWPLAEPQ